MKKGLAVLAVFVSVCAALSAQLSFSAGLGGNFTADFTTYVLSDDYGKDHKAEDAHSHLVGGGIYAFFDASYAEANIGFLFGGDANDKKPDERVTTIAALKLGLFGKYPIDLGGVTFFPMLGIDGQIFLGGSSKTKDGTETVIDDTKEINGKTRREMARDMFNQFWFKGGVGFDIPISGQLYFRAEALYGIRLNTEFEKEWYLKKTDHSAPTATNPLNTDSYAIAKAIAGHGLDIRLAVGYKFSF